jgi:hypothetical protein
MAKYDTYKLSATVAQNNSQYSAEIIVLFEAQDNITAVMVEAATKLKIEAQRLKQTKFLDDIK